MNNIELIANELLTKKKYSKLYKYLQALACCPSSSYYAYLGLCYEEGYGVEKNKILSVQSYIKACLAGWHKDSIDSSLYQTVYESTVSMTKEEKYTSIINYANSCSAKRDAAGELFWLEIALTYEEASAYAHLGDFYRRKEDPMCFAYYEKAYNKGATSVAPLLACCYEDGFGVEKDEKKATEYYKIAAMQGDAEAQFAYAERLFTGSGCDQNVSAARFWCRSAAQNSNNVASIALALAYTPMFQIIKRSDAELFKLMSNNDNARYIVAVLSYIGRFVEQNICFAEKTLAELSDAGFSMAKYALGVISFYSIRICQEDRYKAYFEYMLSASKDVPEANYALGQIYKKGLSSWFSSIVECNPTKAYTYFDKAAKLNCADSMIELGFRYLFGQYTSVDAEKALMWLKKSFDVRAEPEACACIGIIYEKGLCGIKDIETAELWYSRANAAAESYPDGENEIKAWIDALHMVEWDTSKWDMLNKIEMLTKELKAETDEKNMLRSENNLLRSRLQSLMGSFGDRIETLVHTVEKQHAEVRTDIAEINHRTKEMESILKNVYDMQTVIRSKKLSYATSLTNCCNEVIYQKFVDSLATRISDTLYQVGNSCVDREEALLKGMFGLYWETLDPFSRKALVSARVFLANCSSASYSGLDYSGVCISACSALEKELKLRFFTGYKSYLSDRFKTDFLKWPKSMRYNDRSPNERFTIGSMPAIFGSLQRDEKTGKRSLNPKMIATPAEKKLLGEYIKTILYDKNQDSGVFYELDANGLSFLDRCEDVRCIYRNAAAHTESLTLETATACCRDIIGMDHMCAANSVGQIQGLIYDLVRLTKVPKMNNV